MANDIKSLFCDVAFILKFVVLILCCVCAFFVDVHGLASYVTWDAEATLEVAVYGYIVVVGVMLIIYIFDEPQKLFEAIVLIVGGVLSIVGGIICIIAYADYDNDSHPARRYNTGKGSLRDWDDDVNSSYNQGKRNYGVHDTERLIAGIIALVSGVIMIVDGILSAIKAAGK